MTKRTSLFASALTRPFTAAPAPAPEAHIEPPPPSAAASNERRSSLAPSRQGKRVATVYLEPEALKQLHQIALDEEASLQSLLIEGVNAVFAARGRSRIG
jgi:hypothetical protein